jgi:ribosomal-protein-alanine N-acetyltransferase
MSAPVYVLRHMRLNDIAQIVAIDRQAFPNPWSENVYRYEIGQNTLSSMVVLSQPEPEREPAQDVQLRSTFVRLFGRFSGNTLPVIYGYGGFWMSQHSAHISTLATHPDYRGHGFGEVLLAGMIRRALNLDARQISLEVRVSNEPAIALYRKYGFEFRGVKVSYYRDNGEDAYDMRVSQVDDAYRSLFKHAWQDLQQRTSFEDSFSTVKG